MPNYDDTDNSVRYTYTVGTPSAIASKLPSSPNKSDITILSKFTVDGAEYIVTSIAATSFWNLTTLSSVTFQPDTAITTIGESAFQGCTALSIMTLPNTLTSIGNSCFKNCNFPSITIPASVISSTFQPFNGNNNVKTIVINSSEFTDVKKLGCSLSPVESVTYNAAGAIADTTWKTNSNLNNVIFGPASQITSIGSESFRELTKLTSIVIPASVTSIGQNAFVNSPLLSSVTFENTVEKPSKLTTIDYSAFGGTAIASLTIPNSVTTIGNSSFSGCNKLVTVTFEETSKVSLISSNCFSSCSSLTGIDIPNSVTAVGSDAFRDCIKLSSVKLPVNASFTSLSSGVFRGCGLLTNIVIPETVTTIKDFAFYNCDLSSITIPASVATFSNNNVFAGNNNVLTIVINSSKCLNLSVLKCSLTPLTSVTFNAAEAILDTVCKAFPNLSTVILGPAITSIGSESFRELPKLISISIPASVTSIGQNAFVNSPLLSSVTFENTVEKPSKLTTIDYSAFGGTAIASLTIPNSVTTIGNSSFSGCNKLVTVTFEETSKVSLISSNCFSSCSSLTGIDIPNSVTAVGSDAFRDCIKLSSVKLPVNASFTSLSSGVFRGCGLLTNIVIPETVTAINNFAFYNCDLSSITIPASVITGGSELFNGNKNVKTIVINNSLFLNVSLLGLGNGLAKVETATFDAVGAIADIAYLPNIKSLIIGSKITGIGANAYSTCRLLTSVTFSPNSQLKIIGTSAFNNCSALTSIVIPKSVTTISQSAFNGCTLLTSVTFEKDSQLNFIDYSAFSNSGLTSIILPKLLLNTGNASFSYCTKLQTVTFEPGSICNTIETDSFSFSPLLQNVTLPDKITIIKTNAFNSCLALIKINIPSTVEKIDDFAFSNCRKLTQITFSPNSRLNTYGQKVFEGCGADSTELIDIYISPNITKIGNQCFGGVKAKTVTLEAPIVSKTFFAIAGFSQTYLDKVIINYPGVIPSDMLNNRVNLLPNLILGSKIVGIETGALRDLSKITKIIIPASMTNISDFGMWFSGQLKNAFFLGQIPTISKPNNFANINTAYYIDDVDKVTLNALNALDSYTDANNIVNTRIMFETKTPFSSNLSQLKTVGNFSAYDLAVSGLSAQQIKDAGYSAQEMADAGYSAKELRSIGFTISDFNPTATPSTTPPTYTHIFRASELKSAEYSATDLKYFGFTAFDLWQAKYTAMELYNAGYLKFPTDPPDATYTAGYILNTGQPVDANYTQDEYMLFILVSGSEPPSLALLISTYGTSYPLSNYFSAGFKINGENSFFPNGFGVSPNGYGYTLSEFILAGYPATDLKEAGCSAADLKEAGCSATTLKEAGFNATSLKEAGFDATSLRNAMFLLTDIVSLFTAVELKSAAYLAGDLKPYFLLSELVEAGYTLLELYYAGFTASDLKAAGFTATDLKTYFTLDILVSIEFTALELKLAGFSASQLKPFFILSLLVDAGFNVSQLRGSGFTGNELKLHFSLSLLKDGGFSASDLKGSFSLSELVEAAFTSAQLKVAGFTVAELKPFFILSVLVNAGFTALEFRIAGTFLFPVSELKLYFTLSLLKAAGFTALKLKEYFILSELVTAAFTALELKVAGFTVAELKPFFILSVLVSAGFTPSELKLGGFTSLELISAPTITFVNGNSPTRLNPTISIRFSQPSSISTITNYSWSMDSESLDDSAFTPLIPEKKLSELIIPISDEIVSGSTHTFRIRGISNEGSGPISNTYTVAVTSIPSLVELFRLKTPLYTIINTYGYLLQQIKDAGYRGDYPTTGYELEMGLSYFRPSHMYLSNNIIFSETTILQTKGSFPISIKNANSNNKAINIRVSQIT